MTVPGRNLPARRRFLLLDRDGTLIEERNYLADPAEVRLLPGAGEALRAARAAGWRALLATNQSGVARGYFTLDEVAAVHARLRELLAGEGAELDGIYVCPHGPGDGCACRKPLPGLARRAAAEWGFDPAEAVVIGDKGVDVALARAIGAAAIRVRTGYGDRPGEATPEPDHIADDLASAVRWLLRK